MQVLPLPYGVLGASLKLYKYNPYPSCHWLTQKKRDNVQTQAGNIFRPAFIARAKESAFQNRNSEMLQPGLQDKNHVYKRDILRDYALAAADLEEQFRRFQDSGVISFSMLQGILGESNSKGLLWHLKDTAHHLFDKEDTSLEGQYLDWAIGFLFHECLIILESSYQLQKYYPAAQSFLTGQELGRAGASEPVDITEMQKRLSLLAEETQDNMSRMIGRVRQLISVINRLMCAYLAGEGGNRALARLIYDREELLRTVFKDLYDELLLSVFGPEQEKAVFEAAMSLYESGHMARAERAAQKALALNPACPETLALLDKIAQMRQ